MTELIIFLTNKLVLLVNPDEKQITSVSIVIYNLRESIKD